KISTDNKKTFEVDKSFDFKDLRIFPFSTPHDAAEPCGFNIYKDNSKISIATDLGVIDDKLFDNLKDCSFLMLESNYEPNILKLSPYPYKLKQRISSQKGHLSNNDASDTISKLVNFGLKDVLLIHLSKENNVPEIAYETVVEKLKCANCSLDNISLNIAPRDNPSKIFNIL
ncbi:MAG: MBL fold metallo-hydrolase, partial [Clostridia bacterium]